MRKVWIPVFVAFALVGAFLGTRQDAQAIALNESNLPQEADFCDIGFPPNALLAAGGTVQVFGAIVEAGMTEGLGENPNILAEVGFGPVGSDPRFVGGWSYQPAAFIGDFNFDDEYVGTITAPSPVTTTDYAYAYRFSLDGGIDYTYCDLDGAGSNIGVDFDAAELGVMTVNGTGGPTPTATVPAAGGSGGDVTTSVDVIADPGACILIDTATVNYGQLTFSTQSSPQSGGGSVTVSSCSLTTPLDLLARGTDASGTTANWQLTTPPGSDNMCDTGAGGIDQFGQRLLRFDGPTLVTLDLTLTNQTYAMGLGMGQSLITGVDLLMPCVGSSGTGETVSSTVTFTAIPGAPPPEANPCALDIPFITPGTMPADTTGCPTTAGAEISPSCLTGPGALHRQYFAFELQSGQTGTVAVASSWDAVVALYEIDEFTNTATEVSCADVVLGSGTEFAGWVNFGGSTTLYIVQVEGAGATDYGPYDITLEIFTP